MNRTRKRIWLGILLTVFILAGVISGIAYYLQSTYTVETVYVEGNVHYTEQEIKDFVMEGPLGNNSLYLAHKYKKKGLENIPFVDACEIEVMNPTTIKINVIEKILTGYVKFLDSCMYFDKDGYVVESSHIVTAGVPQIVGLQFDHIVLGQKLPIENEETFKNILNITKLLNKYELNVDKIYFSKMGEITIYFDELKVTLGNEPMTLEDKLRILPELLSSLKGKKGVFQMETYDENGMYIFKPE